MSILSDTLMSILSKIQSEHLCLACDVGYNTEVDFEAAGCRNACSGSCEGNCTGSCDMSCSGGCDGIFGYE